MMAANTALSSFKSSASSDSDSDSSDLEGLEEMTSPMQFGRPEYWDRFYDMHEDCFEWHLSVQQLLNTGWFGKYNPVNRDAAVLELGCGTSGLVHHLNELRYRNVVGVDFSAQCVATCCEWYPEETYLQMDARKLVFHDGVFQAVWDKGLMDAVICVNVTDERDQTHSAQVVREAHRVLATGGYYICISINKPRKLLPHLTSAKWADIHVHMTDHPFPSKAVAHIFCYACKK